MDFALLSTVLGAPILASILTAFITRTRLKKETDTIIAAGAEAVANGAQTDFES